MKSVYQKCKESSSLRWFFLGIGIVAVLLLTGMNVYSLYALRESTIESAEENQRLQLEEFTNKVMYRFYYPFRGINKLDMNDLQESWQANGSFPDHFREVLNEAIEDSLFTDIYYVPDDKIGCWGLGHPIYRFNSEQYRFQPETQTTVPKEVCDAIGISKSRIMTVSLENYRWNNKVEFDAHRSMTLGLVNLNQKEIVGHITFMIDKDYLVDSVLRSKLMNQFGDTENSGMVVWLRDWMQNEVLISSNENYQLERGLVDIRQRFHDMLGDWILYASYLESPTVAAAKASVNRNLLLLGIAVIILFGALVFMFINAQKEREFAQRQAGFLANITHELKTPLAVMQAAGENISDGRVTEGERLKNYGDHIYRESIRLRKMIDKLLDVARVDAGETVVEQSPQDLNAFLSEYHKTNREFVERKGFTFNLESEGRLPLVMVDPDHLETILNNLVENSLKYSNSEKQITIYSSYDGQNQVEISVMDRGEGIPVKVQKNIFDKFFRAENAMTANTKGHGLGLSIVKNLVELNGGRISVSSRSGDGSTFTLRFKPLPHPPDHYQRDHKVSPMTSNKTEVGEHV